MSRLKLLSVVVLAAVPMLTAAQARPNFTGTWKCDAKRSTACNTDTIVVKHSGDTMTVQSPVEKSVVQSYKLDGTEPTNDPAQETGFTGRKLPQSKATARWEGSTIVTEFRTMEEPPVIGRSVWRLSPDGKELTIEGMRSGRGGERNTKTVYAKSGS